METYFSILFIWSVQTDFVPCRNSIFFARVNLLLVETITVIRRKQFSKKELILASGQMIFWLVETIFFSIFQRLLPMIFSVTEISGNQFSKRDHDVTNITGSLSCGNHLISFFQTAVNCCY